MEKYGDGNYILSLLLYADCMMFYTNCYLTVHLNIFQSRIYKFKLLKDFAGGLVYFLQVIHSHNLMSNTS